MSVKKKVFLNSYSSMKKYQKDSDDFWRWKLTLKIRFWHFLTAIFGHLTSFMKKSIPFFWLVQSWLQSEMFLSNSKHQTYSGVSRGSFLREPKISIWNTYIPSIVKKGHFIKKKWPWTMKISVHTSSYFQLWKYKSWISVFIEVKQFWLVRLESIKGTDLGSKNTLNHVRSTEDLVHTT